MSALHRTTQEPTITLPDPTRPPKPVPGCTVCAGLDRRRAQAERAGNIGRATTLEIEMRSHPRHAGGAS
ncbi:hypothetical protein ABZ490_51450 [Streptomyces sp. NPDC005811]|uniref:hypothetical protein n=1 Tax=Streptomyces sp. NPDC005811 TaxID=3154565 RepID=UPI0033E9717A